MPENPLADRLAAGLAQYGESVVIETWDRIVIPFLPLIGAMRQFSDLIELAQAHQLTPVQVEDAIALLGSIRRADDPHSAWLAAEILNRHCPNRSKLLAAWQGQPAAEAPQPPS